jgi:hypothetical protein
MSPWFLPPLQLPAAGVLRPGQELIANRAKLFCKLAKLTVNLVNHNELRSLAARLQLEDRVLDLLEIFLVLIHSLLFQAPQYFPRAVRIELDDH